MNRKQLEYAARSTTRWGRFLNWVIDQIQYFPTPAHKRGSHAQG